MAFDAPDGFSTCTRRIRSNTPLQALTLLNDQQFYEMAQALAKRVREKGPAKPEGKLEYAFRICLARKPADQELKRLYELYQQQLVISRELQNRRDEGKALNNLGNAYNRLGDYHHASECFEEQLQIASTIGDRQAEGSALGNLGTAHLSLGEVERASDLFSQHLDIARQLLDRRGVAIAQGNLGLAYDARGQWQRAIELHQESLATVQELGDRSGEAVLLDRADRP